MCLASNYFIKLAVHTGADIGCNESAIQKDENRGRCRGSLSLFHCFQFDCFEWQIPLFCSDNTCYASAPLESAGASFLSVSV